MTHVGKRGGKRPPHRSLPPVQRRYGYSAKLRLMALLLWDQRLGAQVVAAGWTQLKNISPAFPTPQHTAAGLCPASTTAPATAPARSPLRHLHLQQDFAEAALIPVCKSQEHIHCFQQYPAATPTKCPVLNHLWRCSPERWVQFIFYNWFSPKSQKWNLGWLYSCCEVLIECPGPSRRGSVSRSSKKKWRSEYRLDDRRTINLWELEMPDREEQ